MLTVNFRSIPTYMIILLEKSISKNKKKEENQVEWVESWDSNANMTHLLNLFSSLKKNMAYHSNMHVLYYKSVVNSLYMKDVQNAISDKKSWILSHFNLYFQMNIIFKAFPELGTFSLTFQK